MRQFEDAIEIMPGETLALRAGASHIMFAKLRKHLAAGERFAVSLNFKNAGSTTVDLAVQGLGVSKPAKAHDDAGRRLTDRAEDCPHRCLVAGAIPVAILIGAWP